MEEASFGALGDLAAKSIDELLEIIRYHADFQLNSLDMFPLEDSTYTIQLATTELMRRLLARNFKH
jgi:hypothetical protein